MNIKINVKRTLFVLFVLTILTATKTYAIEIFPFGDIGGNGNLEDNASTVQILLLLTILSLAPSILIMVTGFTRITIVLSFIRNALGLQQVPSNQVMIGLALFLTFFVMLPVISEINETAYQPYVNSDISQSEAMEAAIKPIRKFMLEQTYPKDLNMFLSLAKKDTPESYDEIATSIIIPSFITSEIKRAFQMGFFLYIPFIVIDMIVASTLMSMGMMMLPPSMISLPFKVMLFVLVDGWALAIKTLISSFGG